MKDLAAHIPAVLRQHGYDEEASAVRELYQAVLRLKSTTPKPLDNERIWTAGHAMCALDYDERERLADFAEMDKWLTTLAERYERAVGWLLDVAEHFTKGGDMNADVSGEHGALATLIGGLLCDEDA